MYNHNYNHYYCYCCCCSCYYCCWYYNNYLPISQQLLVIRASFTYLSGKSFQIMSDIIYYLYNYHYTYCYYCCCCFQS